MISRRDGAKTFDSIGLLGGHKAMRRILYWNIQNFALNKIANPAAPLDAVRRRTKILNNLTANTPDIFVVVEVSTGGGPVGSPVTGAGANGAMELLALIRGAFPLANWRLVPPLISGTGGFAEGVAVYYNANTVTFTGPNVLRATAGGALVSVTPPIPGGVAAAAYGAPWVGYAPALGGAAVNALPAGNNFAGKVRFHAPPPAGAAPGVTGGYMTFPNLNNRSPYLTTFTEVGGAPRNITVIAFHSSPALAAVGTAFMQGVDEMITPPVGNEVQVMVGDFNVPLGGANAPWVYPPFVQIGFTQHFTLPAPAGQRATHIQPWAGSSPVGPYPHYGYMNTWDSLDNVFTRYGPPVGALIANAALAGVVGAMGVLPAVAPPVVAIQAAGAVPAGTTANIAVAAAQDSAKTAPAVAAALITQLSLLPGLAALPVPAAAVQAAADAIEGAGGAVPPGVTAALGAGGPIALPVAAAAAAAAAIERAGAEVATIADAIQMAMLAAPALGGVLIPGTPAAGPTVAAAVAAVAANAAAAATVAAIGAGPNTAVANAAPLVRAAAASAWGGLVAAIPAAGAIAAIGAAGAAAALGALPVNAMIVNQVTGAPYGPAGPPLALTYPSRLGNPLLPGLAGIGNLMSFRGWNNYRAIRSASDHFALVIDV